jgi:salicylate hydroxylase
VRLSSRVVKVDPESATLTLEDGSKHRGDFIVGADGMHSITVASVDQVIEVSSSINMYRFMVPTDVALQKEPDTLKEWDYQTTMMDYHDFENGRYLITYPCRGAKMLNMVTIQPDAIDNADFGDS